MLLNFFKLRYSYPVKRLSLEIQGKKFYTNLGLLSNLNTFQFNSSQSKSHINEKNSWISLKKQAENLFSQHKYNEASQIYEQTLSEYGTHRDEEYIKIVIEHMECLRASLDHYKLDEYIKMAKNLLKDLDIKNEILELKISKLEIEYDIMVDNFAKAVERIEKLLKYNEKEFLKQPAFAFLLKTYKAEYHNVTENNPNLAIEELLLIENDVENPSIPIKDKVFFYMIKAQAYFQLNQQDRGQESFLKAKRLIMSSNLETLKQKLNSKSQNELYDSAEYEGILPLVKINYTETEQYRDSLIKYMAVIIKSDLTLTCTKKVSQLVRKNLLTELNSALIALSESNKNFEVFEGIVNLDSLKKSLSYEFYDDILGKDSDVLKANSKLILTFCELTIDYQNLLLKNPSLKLIDPVVPFKRGEENYFESIMKESNIDEKIQQKRTELIEWRIVIIEALKGNLELSIEKLRKNYAQDSNNDCKLLIIEALVYLLAKDTKRFEGTIAKFKEINLNEGYFAEKIDYFLLFSLEIFLRTGKNIEAKYWYDVLMRRIEKENSLLTKQEVNDLKSISRDFEHLIGLE